MKISSMNLTATLIMGLALTACGPRHDATTTERVDGRDPVTGMSYGTNPGNTQRPGVTDQTADTDAQRNRRQPQREQDGREPASVNEMQDDAYDREPTYDGSDSTVNP